MLSYSLLNELFPLFPREPRAHIPPPKLCTYHTDSACHRVHQYQACITAYGIFNLALQGRRVSCPLIEVWKPAAFATNPVPQPAGHRVLMTILLAAATSSLQPKQGLSNLLGYRWCAKTSLAAQRYLSTIRPDLVVRVAPTSAALSFSHMANRYVKSDFPSWRCALLWAASHLSDLEDRCFSSWCTIQA